MRASRRQDPDFSLVFTDIAEKLRLRSNVDDLWNKLSDQQKISMMKKHTSDFDASKDELRTLLFTLPITESEVREAYATNGGGGSIYNHKGKLFGSITKANSDGTITITNIWPVEQGTIVRKDTGKNGPQALAIKRKIVSLEDYDVEVEGDLVDVDIYTYYTIMQKRAKSFKYGDEVAKANTVEHYKTRQLTLLAVAVDSISLGDYKPAISFVFTTMNPDDYTADIEEGTELIRATRIYLHTDRIETRMILREIASVNVEAPMMKLTGVDLKYGNLYSQVHEGYAIVSIDYFKDFAQWLADTLKSKRIATGWVMDREAEEHVIKIGRNYIRVPFGTLLTG